MANKLLLPQRTTNPLYRAKKYVNFKAGEPDQERIARQERLKQLSARQPVARTEGARGAGAGALETPVSIANGGTGAATAMAARVNLGVGLVFIDGDAFTAESSVSLDDTFTSDYDNYVLVIDVTAASSTGDVLVRLRASGTDSDANYYNGVYNVVSNNTEGFVGAASQQHWVASRAIGTVSEQHAVCQIWRPQEADQTSFWAQAVSWRPSDTIMIGGMNTGAHNVATAYDGFTILASTGTITGAWRLYAYQQGA